MQIVEVVSYCLEVDYFNGEISSPTGVERECFSESTAHKLFEIEFSLSLLTFMIIAYHLRFSAYLNTAVWRSFERKIWLLAISVGNKSAYSIGLLEYEVLV